MPTDITVSNLSQLESAMAQAKGGETIELQDGYYGSIDISKDFSSTVTIEAINPHKVTFSDIDIPGGSNIHLDGLVINDTPRIDQNAHHVTISNSILENALYFRDADNIVVHGNDISGGGNTLILNDITNFTITENYIHHAIHDVVRITGASKYGLFENNTVYDVAAPTTSHPDLVQMFGNNGNNPTDITFRGNHLYDDPTTGSVYAQGFFFGDPNNGGYKNILIEDNLINVGSPNSIAIHGGQESVVIQNNTLIPWPGGGGAIIRLTDARGWSNAGTTVQDNIAKGILNQTNVPNVSGNYFYGRDADLSKLFSGDGNQWQDFVPVDGSPIDLSTGLGASDRLTDLLNGTSISGSTPTADEPDTDAGSIDETGSGSGDAEQPTPAPEDDTGGTDQGQIDPSLDGAAYAAMGEHEFNSASDVIEVAHSSNLALDAATISFSFNADTVSGVHGVMSKDASYYAGGGNHLVSYIEDGDLIVRFQDGANDEIARVDGIKADTDYDLQVSFGDGNVSVWLNEEQVHSADFSTSWTTNVEYLQFGARGWSSKSGEAGFSDVLDGTISDIIVVEGNLTPAQLQNRLNGTSISGSTPTADEPDTDAGSIDETGSGSGDAEQPTPAPEDDTGGTDQGQIDPSLDGAAYAAMGEHEFNSASDVIEVAHSSNLALDAATISFSFNADTVSGVHGVMSKDASYYAGGGNHLVSYIEDGDLIVRFQDGANDEIARVDGIKADTDYDLQVSFGDGNVSVWLNEEQVHSADFSTSWTTNVEYLQFGARGWSSKSGEAGFSDVLDGTISDIIVVEGNLTPAQLQNRLSPNETGPNVVYEQTAELTFNGGTDSIVTIEHDAAYEVQEGTIAFTFNAEDLNDRQGLFSKDASYYDGGGNHVTAMLEGDELYFRFQDEDSDAVFRAPSIEAGKDYDVQAWFGDGEVGLAVNGELIGTKAFEVDLSLNNQDLQLGGNGWGSSDGGDKISDAFDGTMSDIMILDQAVPIDNGDLIA